jgi:hypothetical protein
MLFRPPIRNVYLRNAFPSLIAVRILNCNGVWPCWQKPAFRGGRTLSSVLKLETLFSSETLVSTYESTQRYYPGDQRRYLRREILRSLAVIVHNSLSHRQSGTTTVEINFVTITSSSSSCVLVAFSNIKAHFTNYVYTPRLENHFYQ